MANTSESASACTQARRSRTVDDFYGQNVILASRVAGKAQGGEILVSSRLKELTESFGEFTFCDGRRLELKGLSGTYRVFAVAWR